MTKCQAETIRNGPKHYPLTNSHHTKINRGKCPEAETATAWRNPERREHHEFSASTWDRRCHSRSVQHTSACPQGPLTIPQDADGRGDRCTCYGNGDRRTNERPPLEQRPRPSRRRDTRAFLPATYRDKQQATTDATRHQCGRRGRTGSLAESLRPRATLGFHELARSHVPDHCLTRLRPRPRTRRQLRRVARCGKCRGRVSLGARRSPAPAGTPLDVAAVCFTT
jgi:hypothetical protein